MTFCFLYFLFALFFPLFLLLMQVLPHERQIQGPEQRWGNSVLIIKYEYEYYSAPQKWPNTNMKIMRFSKMTKYEFIRPSKNDRIKRQIQGHEHRWANKLWWSNTNTNIIQPNKNDQIRIQIFSASQKWLNTYTNTNMNIIQLSKWPILKKDQIRLKISGGIC